MQRPLAETDLYPSVKRLLESQGYEVKSEIGNADIVAMRGDEAPVIVELKKSFSLALVHQAIERFKVTDLVYVAIPEWTGRTGWKSFLANRTLCRRLGLGLITIDSSLEKAAVHLDPGPYSPRKSKVKQSRLLKEFQHRVGDPNEGGSTKVKLITSYRQDALRCLRLLASEGPLKASLVAEKTNVIRARNIMADDHYGWFERAGHGIYAITPKGQSAVTDYQTELESLK